MSDTVRERKTMRNMTVGEYRELLGREIDAYLVRRNRVDDEEYARMRWYEIYRQGEIECIAKVVRAVLGAFKPNHLMKDVLESIDNEWDRDTVEFAAMTMHSVHYEPKYGERQEGE